jgi:hypothetical protein
LPTSIKNVNKLIFIRKSFIFLQISAKFEPQRSKNQYFESNTRSQAIQ